MNLTPVVLAACYPIATADACKTWAPAFDAAAREFSIADPHGIVLWLASMANESGQLTEFRERWRYSAERAAEIYGLSAEDTARYQQSRETWFEFVYGYQTTRGRMLGNTQPGDGGKYYGRGPGQITGRGNVQVVTDATGVDFINHPEKLEEAPDGARAFAAYFTINQVDKAAADGSESSARNGFRVMNSGLRDFSGHMLRWHEVRLGLGIEDDGRNAARMTQARLLIDGYDVGERDGWIGPKTRAAMAAAGVAT